MYFVLFLLGIALGSFLNVLVTRYQSEQKFSLRTIQGRSYCDGCKKQLRWYELIPLVSFIIQKKACRSCGAPISWQHPLVEGTMGILSVLLGYIFFHAYSFPISIMSWAPYAAIVFWIIVSMVLLFALLIDAKYLIIPNGTNVWLLGMGIVWTVFLVWAGFNNELSQGSFLGHFAPLFGLWQGVVLNHLAGMLIGGIFFILIVLFSRGRGMGIGDVKLIGSLGLLFGWPDIGVIIISSFIIGTILVIPLLLQHQKKGSDKIPFGPFIVIASFLVLLWGAGLLQAYFDIIGTTL